MPSTIRPLLARVIAGGASAAACLALGAVPAQAATGTSPLPAPLGACTGGACPSGYQAPGNTPTTKRDASINVFAGGNITIGRHAAEIEGRVVALGDLDDTSTNGISMGFAGGGSQVTPPNGSDWVTIGGDITADSTIHVGTQGNTGNVVYGGTADTGRLDIARPGQAIHRADATKDLSRLRPVIEDRSSCTGEAAATGTVRPGAGGREVFTGDGSSDLQVFNVTGSLGSADHPVFLDFEKIPAGATVVVNVLGTHVGVFSNNSNYYGKMDKVTHTLWNFPKATAVTIAGQNQFPGSILAGQASGTVKISTSGLNGRVYVAGDLVQGASGNGGEEVHAYPFEGKLPNCGSPTPTPGQSQSSGTPTGGSAAPSGPAGTGDTPTATGPTATTPTATAPSSSATAASPATGATSSAATQGNLADTGAGDEWPLVGGAAALVAAGAGALWWMRTRHAGQH